MADGGSGKIKVIATQDGYFEHIYRRPGDKFTIPNEKAFSKRWMKLDNAKPGKAAEASEDEVDEKPRGKGTGSRDVLGGK